MLARIRKSMDEKDKGFTLVELLVVMIIIGILAAIAIPIFMNQREKARDTSTKADVSTVGKEIATYYVDGSGTLEASIANGTLTLKTATGVTPAFTTPIKVSSGTATQATAISYGDANKKDSTWCVGLTNASGDLKDFKYSAQGGLEQGLCVTPTP